MYTLAVAISALAFGLLVGIRGGVVAWIMGSFTIAMVLVAFLWRGDFFGAGVIFGAYPLGLIIGFFVRR
jgi:hypothetical protein